MFALIMKLMKSLLMLFLHIFLTLNLIQGFIRIRGNDDLRDILGNILIVIAIAYILLGEEIRAMKGRKKEVET